MNPLQKTERQNLQIWTNRCIDFMKAYQDQKVDEMIALCDPQSSIWFKPLGDDGKGKVHELGKNLWTALIESFPNIDNTVHSISAEDGKIRCIVSIRGTQQKDFAGIVSKGCTFDSEHIFIFQLDDKQKIQHLDIEWDHTDFVNQLSQ